VTRRPITRLSDADLGRLLAHIPDPPPPSADLTDRIVANVVGAEAGGARRAPRRFGRRIWWAIAILGAAGAVTAAAANAGRFELIRVLAWPQEIARVAGWTPHQRRGALLAHAERPATPRPEAPAFVPPPASEARPLAPLADHDERVGPIGMAHPQRFAGADRIERPLGRPRFEARLVGAHGHASGPPIAGGELRAEDRAALAAPVDRLEPTLAPPPAAVAHDEIERAAKDDALRFHDADEYARRQAMVGRDWRPRDDQARRALTADPGDRPFAADREERRWAADGDHRPATDGDHRFAAEGDHRWAPDGDHRWARPQAWRQRADNRSFHAFRPHPLRERRRG
jgi:hypothetical protein